MMNLTVTFCVLSLILNMQCYYDTVPEFQKGTLVLIVPCDEGILVCADKRIYRPSSGNDDNFEKIIKVDTYNGFAIVGAPIVWRNKIKIFDVFNYLNERLRKEKISDSTAFWNNLMSSIRSEYINSVLNAPYSDWPESQYPQKNYILFEVVFFHYDDRNNPKMSLLQFRYIKQMNPIVEVNVYDLSVKGSFSAFGSGHVILELQNGNKTEFDYLRNDPRLNKILKNKVAATELNLEDAIYFCTQMIMASHNMYNLVSEIDAHIGPTYDLLLLGRNGLKYLNK